MDKIEVLKNEIERLSPAELANFRNWLLDFDAEAWDRQIEMDAAEGNLDRLATKDRCPQQEDSRG